MGGGKTGLSHTELPWETRLFPASSGQGLEQRSLCREAGGACTGMLLPAQGTEKTAASAGGRAAGPQAPLPGCWGDCRVQQCSGTELGSVTGGAGPVPLAEVGCCAWPGSLPPRYPVSRAHLGSRQPFPAPACSGWTVPAPAMPGRGTGPGRGPPGTYLPPRRRGSAVDPPYPRRSGPWVLGRAEGAAQGAEMRGGTEG